MKKTCVDMAEPSNIYIYVVTRQQFDKQPKKQRERRESGEIAIDTTLNGMEDI
jgi:hypothetical protein